MCTLQFSVIMRCVFLILNFAVFSFGSEVKSYRLPTDAIPSHYSIKLRPDIDNGIFDGEVTIYVRTRNVLNKITLHAAEELNITAAYINHIRSEVDYEDNEKISLGYASDCIQPGEHILRFVYTGVLRNSSTGFLKIPYSYAPDDGFIVVSDFEPTSARRAFPCFDEPSFKAKYNIRLVTPDDTYTAISNMPQINKFTTREGIVYDFATSLTMSTYLVSFAFTTYPYYEDVLEDGNRTVPIRIYSYNASKENNEHAINCTKNALQYYSEYTNIGYPLSKLDMIEYSRPETAATENWGLITFREGLLNINLNIYDDVQIKVVIYHEISHFWFGNLVTNDWWNDIWLQEGFATYMSYKLYKRDMEVQPDRISFFFDGFFEIDNEKPTRPIVEYLETHDRIQKRFDTAVYNKGAAILLMIESIIGEQAFQKVIQQFLKKYAYRTATTNDFISTIEEVVPHMNTRGFVESYVYQNRFPLIVVDQDNGTFVLKQQVCATSANFSESGQKWTVPITYITDKNKTSTFVWFDKDMESLTISVPDANWILLNSQGTGIYKVLFSERQWKSITSHFQEFNQTEGNTLIFDAIYSFKFGLVNCDVLLNLMKQVNNKRYWSSFSEFHLIVQQQLRCNNYKDEIELYIDFLNQRFRETDYPRSAKTKRNTCSKKEGIYVKPIQTEQLQKCAQWIRENLSYNNSTEAV